jgi:hypothetical protein
MGVLDMLSGGEDPDQRAGMTALAMGLLSGGNFNEALSKGIGARQQAIYASQDQKTKNLQRSMLEQQIAQAKISAAAQRAAEEFWAQGMGQQSPYSITEGQPAAPGMGGQGLSQDGVYAPQPKVNGNDWIRNLDGRQVEMLERGGRKVGDTWKFLNTPQSVAAGATVVPVGGGPTWTAPNLEKGMQMSGGRAINTPGNVEALATQTAAVENAKADAQIIEVPMGDGRVQKMTYGEYKTLRGQAAPQAPTMPSKYDGISTPDKPDVGSATGAFAGDTKAIWQQIQSIKDPVERLGAQQAYMQQFGSNPSVKPVTLAQTPANKVGVSQSTLEKSQQEATGKDFAENGKNIINIGMTARSNLSKLDRMDYLLSKVGPTGNFKPYIKELQSFAASFGVNVSESTGFAEGAVMLALGMAGELKKPGSGTTTDKDFDTFVEQIPSISRTPGGNKIILETLRGYAKRDKEISDLFKSKFKGVYSNEAQQAIDAYIDANPVFKQKAANKFEGFSIIRRR